MDRLWIGNYGMSMKRMISLEDGSAKKYTNKKNRGENLRVDILSYKQLWTS